MQEVSEFIPSSRSLNRNKQNEYSLNMRDIEYIKRQLKQNENDINNIKKQLKYKVNKTQFISAISSKLSISDITNISFNNSYNQQTSNINKLIDKIQIDNNINIKRIQNIYQNQIKQIKNIQLQLINKFQLLEQKSKNNQSNILKQLRDNHQYIINNLQIKLQRSQFDKMMHLSSLLAIQFQLIKKRFNNFQIDYNLIWKEISKLYNDQQNLRSVFQTQKKISIENTQQKQIQVLLKTGKHPVGKLFNQNQNIKAFDALEIQHIPQFQQKLESVQKIQNDHDFTIRNFLQRLEFLEQNHGTWLENIKEINKLKRQYNDHKIEMSIIQNQNKKLREDIQLLVDQQCRAGVIKMSNSVNHEIKQACQQMTLKIMQMFSEYVKFPQIEIIRKSISALEEDMNEKLSFMGENYKKRFDNLGIKYEQHDDKIRLISKDIGNRLKIQDFQNIKQNLMSIDTSQNLIKKSQLSIKKDLNEFKDNQRLINEVICAQTILARWIWISGQLKGGNLICWDKQSINTLPQNFIYNQLQYNFKIMNSGIYKLQMGFYAKKKPSIQIIINGKTIISAVNNSSYVVHHSSGKLKDINNSQISGLTYYDYFTLQENTRLAISYSGQTGHGFFGIQRL